MSLPGIRLESVRRKTGGRIHLTPRVPKSGPVTTLCGQSLADGTSSALDDLSDCTNCPRRPTDQGRISGAFFAQEEGSELLRLSLEQARRRKPTDSESAGARPRLTVGKPGAWPAAKPPREIIPERPVGALT